jgi:hypothetical protein
MNLLNLVKNLLNIQKKVEKRFLPSQGLFYKDDFEISIRKAEQNDINEYEVDFIKDNLGLIIYKVKKIVEKNIVLTKEYTFEDIKSIDVVFLFLEIVKFTKGKSIKIDFINEMTGKPDTIEFSSDYFNYFKLNDNLIENYNKELKCFEIDGYKFSLPTIGIENCLTNFLIFKHNNTESEKYNDYFYEFTYFLLDRKSIGFEEIENMIQIFNHDIEPEEFEKINNILKIFLPLQKYSLIRNGKVIDINSRIDLEKIWK